MEPPGVRRVDMTDQSDARSNSEDKDETEDDHLMTEDEKVDEAGEESFPASDPPAMP
jgi:hypothetical protein